MPGLSILIFWHSARDNGHDGLIAGGISRGWGVDTLTDRNRLPERWDAETARVAHSSDRLPASAPPPPPTHGPQQLQFGGYDVLNREDAWNRLGTAIREKVIARAGQWCDWWAINEEDGRISAVILGTHALVTVTPTVNSSGGPAHRMTSLALDETSFRQVRVAEQTRSGQYGNSGDLRTTAQPTSQRSMDQLSGEFKGVLGNLPRRAQLLLQEPFQQTRSTVQAEYRYVRSGVVHSLGGATLRFWCYLTDQRMLTFAGGTGHGFGEAQQPASWDLTCWRAATTRAGR